MKNKKSKDEYNVEVEHWSSPVGCHPDCPACTHEPQHTSTPWNVGGYQTHSASVEPLGVVGIGNGRMAIARSMETGLISREEAEANAAFIVKAVNAFEDMKRALWACQIFLIDDEIYAQTKELRNTVEKALAKAEAK